MTPLHEVITNKNTNINPVWIMRQAGRYLPEFRDIRSKNTDFIKLCLNSILSTEITLQPLKRFNFLIFLNSGKYLPACLINQIGFLVVFLFITQS